MSHLTAFGLYFLSCAPGVGTFVFAGIAFFLRGDFKGTLGLLGFLSICVGSFALITGGLFIATGVWIIIDASHKNRPQLLIDFAEAFNVKGMLRLLLIRSLPGPVSKGEANNGA